MSDPDGQTARYRYDGAGNRLGIDRFPTSQLSLLAVVPTRAAAGAKVTLSGTGFSAAPEGNTVSFNGKPADVVSSTATRVVVTVPDAVTAGKVSVTVGGTTQSSAETFTPAVPPKLTGMTPATGAAGTEVVLAGANFAETRTNNVVRFNGGTVAEVTGQSATSLTVRVPQRATTGRITLDTPDGRATAAGDFTIPLTDEQLEMSLRADATDTQPTPFAVTQPGFRARILFDANQGEDISLALTESTFRSVSAKLIDPQGTQIGSTTTYNGAAYDWDLRDLPLSGTYALLFVPGSNGVGSANATLSYPVGGKLDFAAAPAVTDIQRQGQNGRWTFDATAGEPVSLGIDALTLPQTLTATLYGPTGAEVDDLLIAAKNVGSIDIDQPDKTGTYQLVLDPSSAATGTVKVSASHYAGAGQLTADGAATKVTIDRPGQNGITRFSGQTGQRLSLAATITGFDTLAALDIRGPDGKQVDSLSAVGGPKEWDLAPLPATGVYTVYVEPSRLGTGTVTLTLSRPVSLPQLSSTATEPVRAVISRFGQDAETTFPASTGNDLSLGLTSNTFTGNLYVTVLAPSGATVVDGRVVAAGQAASLTLGDLSETGTYRVVLDPFQDATGAISLLLSADLHSSPILDGASAPVSINRAGQHLRANFTAPPGGTIGIGITDNTLTDTLNVTLLAADGTVVEDLGTVTRASTGAKYMSSLTSGAAYTLLLEPNKAVTGSLTLWLSSPVTAGTLTDSTPTTTGNLTRPGQQLVLLVPATAASGKAVTFTNSTLGSTRIATETPDGSITKNASTLTAATGEVDLRAPLAAGTHRVLLRPDKPVTGAATATQIRDIDAGALIAGGAKRPAAITTGGQNAHFTFTGTQGQKVTVTTDTPPYAWDLSVANPDGTWLADARRITQTTTSLTLTTLPANGTYTLTVDPSGQATGTLSVGITAAVSSATERQPLRPRDNATTASGLTTGPKTTGHKSPPATAHRGRSVPTGPDTWQPGQDQLAGHAWSTGRSRTPAAPAPLPARRGTTALTGRVLKLDGKPLADVTVRIGGTARRTDARGRFVLDVLNSNATTLTVDGRTANTRTRHYGIFDIHVSLRDGKATQLGFPVWMTPLDTKHTVAFDAPTRRDVVLKTPKIPGLEVRIPKGSVVRDQDGKPVTELGITAVPIDRPPFPLPKNSEVPVYFTVQPGGTYVFPKGAQIIYPNYTHQPPGQRTDFISYDPKKKGWHVYGHGTVSADGTQVVPDDKTRVWQFTGAMISTSDLLPFDIPIVDDILDWLSGDPVDLGTGLLTDARTDLAVADAFRAGEVTRTYWQGDSRTRAFGIGRDLSYNISLYDTSRGQRQSLDMIFPGGRVVPFKRTSPGDGFGGAVFEPLTTPTAMQGAKITWNPTTDWTAGWRMHFRDGTDWFFPEYAPLSGIRDRHGNTLRLTRSNGNRGDLTHIATPTGRWIDLAYDDKHRATSAKDNTGRSVSYTYDAAGRLETVTDPAGETSRYTYDGSSNRIRTALDARGITYMTNDYYADGRVKKQTLTEGASYSFVYALDADGKLRATEVTQPGGAVRRVQFGTDGVATSDTQAYGTSLARTTVYQRGGTNHRIDSITDPYGRRTDLTYDPHGYLESATELAGTTNARSTGKTVFDGPYDQPTQTTDPLQHTTAFQYDADNNMKSVIDAENRTTSFTHSPEGQVKTVTDPSGAVTEYTYRNGDLASVKDNEGRTSSQFTDAAGRPAALADTTGSATTLVYDQLNQTREITDPLGNTTVFGYDENGNVTTLMDARRNTATWTYDQADRPRSATDPLGVQATFEYDAVGAPTRVTNRSGQAATAEYDLLGRAKNAKYGVDALGQAESTVTYDYDAVDLLKKITDSEAGTTSFSYDAYDRPDTTTGPTGTVGYGYDAADQRTRMTAAGIATIYGYDKSGILTSVKSGSQEVTFGLDEAGREKTATLPGGITRTTGYDKTGRVASIAYSQGSKNIGDLTYTRDTRGIQTALSGSLASIALPAAEAGAAFDKDNRLTTFGGRSFTYDKDGQLANDGQRTYTWNARGRLTGLTKAGQNSTFTYDTIGDRTSATISGTTRKFLTDGSNPVAEQNATGETTATVATSGLDAFLTRTESGKTQIYLTDALGSIVGLADSDGTLATRYTYDPNGQPTPTGAISSNPYTFTGRENDGTGLLYYRSRYYDPQTGRFISQDPIGYTGGTNLYQYALSAPTTYTDPTGNSPLIAGCVIGGLMEGGMDWLGQRLSGRKVNWGQVGGTAAAGCLTGMLGVPSGGKIASRTAGSCLRNSFTGHTTVLMADGTRKPIKDVRIGEEVLATDPETGETGAREVTALIQGSGGKQLVDITVDTDGGSGAKTGTITATDGHPFWAPERHQWVTAGDLKAGQWLQTSAGTWVQVAGVRHRTQSATVYNLTVDGLHTYFVHAGTASVLAHNCTTPIYRVARHENQDELTLGLNPGRFPRDAENDGAAHFGNLQRVVDWLRQHGDTHGPGYRIEVPTEWLNRHTDAGNIEIWDGITEEMKEYVIPRELFDELNQFGRFPWSSG
ncbi:RHS repeat-associated core domain-containing protein [Streptomyces phaeochromogenes]